MTRRQLLSSRFGRICLKRGLKQVFPYQKLRFGLAVHRLATRFATTTQATQRQLSKFGVIKINLLRQFRSGVYVKALQPQPPSLDGHRLRQSPARLQSDGFGAAFACTDTDAIVHWQNENFPVSDLAFFARLGGGDNGIYCRFDEVIVDGDLQLDFAEQVNRDFMAAVGSDLPLLPTEPLAIENRQAEHLDFG